MLRKVVAILGGLVVLAAIGAAIAHSTAGPNGQLAAQDRLWGGGGTEPGCFVPDIGFCRVGPTNFALDAHATASDRAAFGDRVGAGLREQVTCLRVDGRNASVGGIVTSDPENPSAVGDLFLQFYVDSGSTPGADLVSPFYVGPGPSGWPAGFPDACPSPDTGAPDLGLFRSFIPVSRGDIVIQDASS